MQKEFIEAIQKHQKSFSLNLNEDKILELAKFYQLVTENNEILHLVAPCSPEEFAVRHILESLTVLEYLPANTSFADVGTGAGLPSIPCLIVRQDLKGVLIESKLKKANYLQKVLTKCELENRAKIINRQFEEIPKPNVSYVLCRALDKFTQKLPKLLKWKGKSGALFFGGNSLRDQLEKLQINYASERMPESEQRYLFRLKI